MKNILSKFFSLLILCLVLSCTTGFQFTLLSPKEIKNNEKLSVAVEEKNGQPIDSIRYYLDGVRLSNHKDIDLSDKKLGKHAISATIFYGDKQKQLTNSIIFLASNRPEIYTYEIVNTYPHDAKAFTQGLEYHNGYLYETTGELGESSLRKVELTTGKVLQKVDLDATYFGEGMTIFNDKIYMLTWQNKVGFVFDLDTFDKIKEFPYGDSKEGWGLAHFDQKLVKSDGTERLWFLNPETLEEQGYIEAYTHKDKVDELNELEFIDGKIYANKWQTNSILLIDPLNGMVEGIVDLAGLQEKAGQSGSNKILNGIAYDAQEGRLFVTGKDWNSLFEIKLSKK